MYWLTQFLQWKVGQSWWFVANKVLVWRGKRKPIFFLKVYYEYLGTGVLPISNHCLWLILFLKYQREPGLISGLKKPGLHKLQITEKK